jgi:SNF2 family DNA or RNA helicase
MVSLGGGRFRDPRARSFTEILPHFLHKRGELPLWVITHYAGIRVSQDSYEQVPWEVVIGDELHYVKNRNARRSRALLKISKHTRHRIGLTATPFSNNPADLWAQLHWIAPEVEGLRSYWRFYGLFVDFEMKDNSTTGARYRHVKGGKNLELLTEVMHHYGLQRTKAEVAPQLPPLTRTEFPLELNGRQGVVYKALASSAVELAIKHTGPSISDVSKSAAATSVTAKPADAGEQGGVQFTGVLIRNMLSRLVRMEQWLSHPWTFDPGMTGTKLEWLLDWVKSTNHQVVVATRFRASAVRVGEELGSRVIYGKVSLNARETILEDWQKGNFQTLVGTINTIGTGLNLQQAWTLVCYDQMYSAILMEQLQQRIHRINSTHPAEVIFLYHEDTSNEVVLRSFQRKWNEMEMVRALLRQLQNQGIEPGRGGGS